MAEWDLIESGYNAADETINFGTRIFGDCENLYETCTVATIKHSTEAVSTKTTLAQPFATGFLRSHVIRLPPTQ